MRYLYSMLSKHWLTRWILYINTSSVCLIHWLLDHHFSENSRNHVKLVACRHKRSQLILSVLLCWIFRCIASCVAVCIIIALMLQVFTFTKCHFTLRFLAFICNFYQFIKVFDVLFFLQGQHDLTNKSSLEEMLEKAKEQGKLYLEEPFHQKDFHHYFNCQTWEEWVASLLWF